MRNNNLLSCPRPAPAGRVPTVVPPALPVFARRLRPPFSWVLGSQAASNRCQLPDATGKSTYFLGSRVGEARFRALVRCFAPDLTATATAELTGLSVRSVNSIVLRIHRRIAGECERHAPFSGQVEVDESFFGPSRVRGKRGRGACV